MSKGKEGLKASYIHSSIDESLQRLQTDYYVDLYQSHVDDESTPLEETLTAYDKLIKAGKVRMIGASNYSGARLTEALEASRALGVAEYVTLQPSYNLHTRENYETDLAPVVAKYGLSVIPYRALGSGFLTGKYKSVSDIKGSQREVLLSREGYFDARGEKILTKLADIAAEANASQAAVALAWLLTQPGIVSPIASARTPEQLNSLFEAAKLELTPSALKQLTEASAY